MKDRNPALLSHRPIERQDLLRLARIAREDRASFFRKYPDWAACYSDRVLGAALCQGGALHYLDPTAGLNDFDVYTFYAENPIRTWYAKRMKRADFGDSKFGVSEVSRPGFIGRRVDLMGRALPVAVGTDLCSALRQWLSSESSETARELARKAVIILEPID